MMPKEMNLCIEEINVFEAYIDIMVIIDEPYQECCFWHMLFKY